MKAKKYNNQKGGFEMEKYKIEDVELGEDLKKSLDNATDDSEEMTDEEYANQMWEDEDLDDFFSDILNN